jgi:two-component system, OmpR family, response regulator ChvI
VKILITDTDFDIINDVSSSLSLLVPDWEWSVINLGKECLNVIKNDHCPDLVIIGTQLSDMTGFELVMQIRDVSYIPVIFICNKDIDMLSEAFNSGADDYVVSPFNKQIFVARLKALIRRIDWDIKASENKLRGLMKSM